MKRAYKDRFNYFEFDLLYHTKRKWIPWSIVLAITLTFMGCKFYFIAGHLQ